MARGAQGAPVGDGQLAAGGVASYLRRRKDEAGAVLQGHQKPFEPREGDEQGPNLARDDVGDGAFGLRMDWLC